MSFPMETSFSIENIIDEDTKQPFGSKYGGLFKVRRPTLQDKTNIAAKKAAMLSAYGATSPEMIGNSVKMLVHIFAFVTTVATDTLPTWFNMNTMYDEDQNAVVAVWEEVGKFLDTFRPENGRPAGGAGEQQPSDLVPGKV